MINARELYQGLLSVYGRPGWWSDDPFIVMFQAVLVQNTTWNSVQKTCAAIGDALTPQSIDCLTADALEAHIRPCGFYKAKARTIKALVDWFRQYGFDCQSVQKMPMQQLRKELLAIRGIGAETADVILVYAFYKPAFVVDAYTRRFLQRLGYGFSSDDAVRAFFTGTLPRDAHTYGWCHWLILEHCISVCKKTPICRHCPFTEHCRLCAAC